MLLVQRGQPGLILAPMQGVTDAPMRQLMGELGGFSLCVAEFLRISQVAACVPVVARHVPELRQAGATSSGLPVQVQLLGGDPERLAASAQAAVRAQVGGPALGVDLNFGCPARTVNRHDGGASLLQHPGRLFLIVQAVRQALPPHIAVSAKLRLGWDDPRDVQRAATWISRWWPMATCGRWTTCGAARMPPAASTLCWDAARWWTPAWRCGRVRCCLGPLRQRP
jgi:tRNA-dihydrouridine synthase C